MYGPSVLAADLGTELLDKVDFYETGHNETKYYGYPGAGVAPAVVGSGESLAAQARPVDGEPATFHLRPVNFDHDLTLRPYARTHFVRYTVYFRDYPTAADYQRHQADVAAAAEAARKLAARTVDEVRVGEQQSEVDHGMVAKNSRTAPFRDGHWRDATTGGLIQYTLHVPAAGAYEVAATYWGDDAGRTFDVQIDGKTVATEILNGGHPGEFFDRLYKVSTPGPAAVTVRFVPHAGSTAGGVFGVRLLRSE